MEHPALKRKYHDGGTKDQRAIDVADGLCGLLQRKENCDAEVEQEKQDQERFSRRKILRAILEHAPGGANREGEYKPGDIQRPPSLEPRNGQNARVEHRVVAEKHDMASLAGRRQNR